MPFLDHCFVDQVTETVQIFDVDLDTTASSLNTHYRRSEVSSTEELNAHLQHSRALPHTCRVMFVAFGLSLLGSCG